MAADKPRGGGAQGEQEDVAAQAAFAKPLAGEKPIEKIKPDKEQKLEHKEFKPEFKEHKQEHKEFKHEHKELKPEIKEHKPEKEGKPEKEHKELKPEIKEVKEHKVEGKELKEVKLEVKEVEKPVFEKGGKELVEGGLDPGELVKTVGREQLLAHADSLVEAGQQLRHFIEKSDRPDLGEGALQNEPDQG